MFCGKSEELIRRVRRAQIAHVPSQIFSHEINVRDGKGLVASRNGETLLAEPVGSSAEILKVLKGETRVVAIDEGNFFDEEIYHVARYLSEGRGLRIIIAGLDKNFRGEPFGSMGDLMTVAREVTKLTAICMSCHDEGSPATYTQRLVNGEPAKYFDPVILVEDASGESNEKYEARCDECWEMPDNPYKRVIYDAQTMKASP